MVNTFGMNMYSFVVCGNNINYYPLHRLAVLNPLPQFAVSQYSKGAVKPCMYGDNGDYKTEKIIILANNVCNLKCVYCYAGQGHKSKSPVVSLDQIKSFVDFVTKTQREKGDTKLKVVFLGGGEPFMSYPLIKDAVQYIHEKSLSVGMERTIEIVTNGTFINDEIVRWINKYDIRLDVSFEILEDIQQIQRGHYQKVHTALQLLDEKGVKYKTRTVVSPLNVSRLVEMVHVSKSLYPNNIEVRMELVSSKTNSGVFFEEFLKNYFKAKDIGEKLGIKVNNSKINAFNYLRDYHCYPELALTPEGNISVCHRYSDVNDPLYGKFSMGKVDNIDIMDVQRIRSIYNNKMKKCCYCIAKYHCGGGCIYNNLLYPNQREDYCKMMILSVKLQIIKKLIPELYASYISGSMNFDDFSKQTVILQKQSDVAFYPLNN